ncbi:MAG TPA: hypothetical protein VNU66_13345, partial [Mycobacteriales bacterium]|nr:hypothetical protein [Mycobacteriales bacterium]
MPQPSRRPLLSRSASAAVPAAVLLLVLAVLAAAGPAAVDLRRAQAAAAVGPDAGSTAGPGRRAVVPATGPGAAPAAPPPPSAAPAALAPAPVSAALDAACDAVRFAELPCVHGHGPEAVHAAGGRHGASAPAVAVRCDGDGREGNRLQVVYVRAEGRPDRRPEVAERLRRVVAVANGVVTRSSDGRRALRVVHDASCAVDLPRLTVPRERLGAFAELAAAARQAGLSRVDRKYLLLVDDDRGCALAEQYHDDRPGTENRNNDGDMVAALWLPCWDGVLAAHEVVHLLGGVQPSAPRSTGRWSHCTDGHDVMCYPDGSGQRVTARCAASSATLLD